MTNNNLFFLCSLIEFIGRRQRLPRNNVVSLLGHKTVKHIYEFADVLHCEPISKVADEYIDACKLKIGIFDNIKSCKYLVPSYWDIGRVYARLVQDVAGSISEKDKIIQTLYDVYNSWISDSISNFNSDFFYQPHDYIRECYFAGQVL